MLAVKEPPMPPTETRRETWAHWTPDHEPTHTIDQLIETATTQGLDVDRTTIRFWQTAGVLPHPVRRRMGRGVYAIYPVIAVEAMKRIRELQEQGLTLEEIGPRIRGYARTLATTRRVPQSAIISLEGHAEGTSSASGSLDATVNGTVTDPIGIGQAVAEAAKRQETLTGSPVQRVEVTFIDDNHRRTTYEFSASDRWE